eukprot:scaffold593_cov31-Attheya_sp.AAC.1
MTKPNKRPFGLTKRELEPEREPKPTDKEGVYNDAAKSLFAAHFKPKKIHSRGRPKKRSNAPVGKRLQHGVRVVCADQPLPVGHPFFKKVTGNTSSAKKQEVKTVKSKTKSLAKQQPKKKRANHAKERPEEFRRIVEDWNNMEGEALDINGDPVAKNKGNLTQYGQKFGIPYNTLYKYCRNDDVSKRGVLGNGIGPNPLMSSNEVSFMVAVAARADRGNDGLTLKELADKVQELRPDFNRLQASRQVARRVIPEGYKTGILKKGTVIPQATTTDRTGITISDQYRWHLLVDAEYDRLRLKNIGICPVTRKTFGELMDAFVIGLDEMSIAADHAGNIRIVAAANKKKHEKILQDSRFSITVVRTGNTNGSTGPTIFLGKGTHANRHKDMTDEWLLQQGMAPGSTIIMTENAYMTNEAWIQAAPHLMKGYRQMPIIKDNPDWGIVELLDGFKSHEACFEANKARTDANCRSIKENSQSSHANQGYDQLVARDDKRKASDTLAMMRQGMKFHRNPTAINQWDLIICAIHVIRKTAPETWQTSYDRVNVRPSTRVVFNEFIQRIAGFIAAGSTYKQGRVEPTALDKYALLPGFYHGMTSADKKQAVAIVNKYADPYASVECVEELCDLLKIPLSSIQDLRVCIALAIEHPEITEMVGPPSAQSAVNDDAQMQHESVIAGVSAGVDVNAGLVPFQLVPKDTDGKPTMAGELLLNHQCSFRNQHAGAKASPYLDLAIADRQMEVVAPTAEDLSRGRLLQDVAMDSSKKMSTRKLNSCGIMTGHCMVINSEEGMKRAKDDLLLTATMESIKANEQKRADSKKREKEEKMRIRAPTAAARVLAMSGSMESRLASRAITKLDMAAILWKAYNVDMGPEKAANKKDVMVKRLCSEYNANPEKFEECAEKERANSLANSLQI